MTNTAVEVLSLVQDAEVKHVVKSVKNPAIMPQPRPTENAAIVAFNLNGQALVTHTTHSEILLDKSQHGFVSTQQMELNPTSIEKKFEYVYD